MNVIWYTAMSMDGRLATADHELGFLDAIGDPFGGDAQEFDRFLESVDSVIVGATTLRWLLRGGHGWPHDDLPTWLVSHDGSLAAEVGDTRAPLTRVEGDLAAMVSDIEGAGHQRTWLAGGGDVAGQLLALDRVDEVICTVAPAALGSGPALFAGDGLEDRRFHLMEARPWGKGARLHWVRER